ncbi:hypothetical protein BLNAU_2774 [Blattamonas nauphoetae]|uniref:Uncharacterized protein n=1 Tax=Blattamonas nauphoetae TaxID=2049346 RepID=A0ABQ9YEB0_9EUKA|nr:hypothetical protein BLNAU_11918 [Blattamonas nauphoetae]KAK2962114.1 hypothetical protein BLNAU_2774 [Blattamonas nauphoetae]
MLEAKRRRQIIIKFCTSWISVIILAALVVILVIISIVSESLHGSPVDFLNCLIGQTNFAAASVCLSGIAIIFVLMRTINKDFIPRVVHRPVKQP